MYHQSFHLQAVFIFLHTVMHKFESSQKDKAEPILLIPLQSL